ncbi:MAG: BrnA antitoxin family protein [Acetobacteraceae bacterium]|nr:BrnA antitoxin family protein [Acetobacteraceae bacterium]
MERHPRKLGDRAAAVIPPGTKLISLGLDSDVIDWFGSQGAGYQTRIKSVLRVFMEHEQRKKPAV